MGRGGWRKGWEEAYGVEVVCEECRMRRRESGRPVEMQEGGGHKGVDLTVKAGCKGVVGGDGKDDGCRS